MDVLIEINGKIETNEVFELYLANEWSSAQKLDKLIPALQHSDTLITARVEGQLVGIANAISDGYLVVYYPHMLVHPNYQRKGIGRKMMQAMLEIYKDFHQQMLTADGKAIEFYKSLGFECAGSTQSMWIYLGQEH